MSIKYKTISAIVVIFTVIAGLFFIGKFGFNILSGMRAYVGGEGLWAKSQKEAIYQLSQYIYTADATTYQSFLDNLKVPLGDRVARLELEKPELDRNVIVQGFMDGGNHPEDIPTMIYLYQNFKHTEYVAKAIQRWETGDRLIGDLMTIGKEIHGHISKKTMDDDQAAMNLAQLHDLQKKLSKAENEFSFYMTEASRWASGLLFKIMLVFSIIGSLTCLIMVRLVSKVIFEVKNRNAQLEIQAEREDVLKKELIESEKKFHAIADTSPLAIYMSKGIEQTAVYVNPTFTEMFGYTFDEVPTVDHWWPLAYPDETYRTRISEEWQKKVVKAIETKTETEPMEVQVTCKDGKIKTISWSFITMGTENWACGLDLTERKRADVEREELIDELRNALSEIKTLRGILPICSYCKNIRNDDGYFEQIESYLHKNSGVDFTHTICVSCLKKHFPEQYEALSKKGKV